MKSRINDRICAIVFLAFGIALFISVPRFTEAAKYDPIGSRFFPYAIAVCLLGVAGLLLADTFYAGKYRKKDAQEPPFRVNARDNLRTILFCTVLLASIFLVERVHFLAGAFVMLTAMLFLCRVKKPLRYVIVYGCAVAAYFVFTRYFNVRI